MTVLSLQACNGARKLEPLNDPHDPSSMRCARRAAHKHLVMDD